MPSCLVVANADDALLNAMRGLMGRAWELATRTPWDKTKQFELDELFRHMMSVKYHDPLSSDMAGPICHANIDTKKDEGKLVSQIIDDLPTLATAPLVLSMDDKDKLIQKKILTVVLATLCYMNTKNPDQQKYKFHDRPKLGIVAPTAVIVGSDFDRCPPGWHLRQAHFRTLGDERFRRDESGQARVIWVKGAEVGKGREPAGDEAKEVEAKETEQASRK